ncbi:MAG TPA: methyltransferase domain-containing protein [Trebonia sp.]|nr:methyltransferase domain-containing protein [Trebonia sp.]
MVAGAGGIESWLATAVPELAGLPGAAAEYSVRLAAGHVSKSGRCTLWASGDSAGPAAMRRLLTRLGAPAAVLAWHAAAVLPVRQGIGVDASGGLPCHRLYLHGRAPATLADRYECWRWQAGGEPAASAYSFHFLPETPAGLRPAGLVDGLLRPGLELLLAEDRLRQSSGFWLRADPSGTIDQLDLAFPWHPAARSLPGLAALARSVGVVGDAGWGDLPVRHVALPAGRRRPSVTLYASAPTGGPMPLSEAGMQAHVRRRAAAVGTVIEGRTRPSVPPAAAPAGDRLGEFYDGEVASWQRVLGPQLHYHHGLFCDGDAARPGDMDAALERAVTELYPLIPAGGRLYDIGCGWGGPLAMFIRDLRCPSLGITISRDQFRYAAGLGLPVRWGDAERTLPPGHFDCAVLLESLEHIRDKGRLLEVLALFADRLVMRVNCQDSSTRPTAFGETMHMISSARLRMLLGAAGWHVTHWRDRRAAAMPSAAVWHARARQGGQAGNAHLRALAAWSGRVLAAPAEWAAANPLIEVAAVRA